MSFRIAKLEFDNEQIGSEIVWYTFKNKTKEEHIYVKETIEEIFNEKTYCFVYYVTDFSNGLQGFLVGRNKDDKVTVDVLSVFVSNTYGLESYKCVSSRESKYTKALFAPLKHIRVYLNVALEEQQVARKVYKLGFRLLNSEEDLHNNTMLANLNRIKGMSTDEWHQFVEHHCLFSFLEKNLYIYDPQMSDAPTHQVVQSMIPFLPIFNDLNTLGHNPVFNVQEFKLPSPSKIQSYIRTHKSRDPETTKHGLSEIDGIEDLPPLEHICSKMVEVD